MLVGGIIILIGILALLANLDILDGLEEILGSLLFFTVAYLFYRVFKKDKNKIWALIPAVFCAALGVIIFMENFSGFNEDLSGVILFWAGALVFAYFYINDNKKWWAVIPAGVLFTIGSVVIIETYNLLLYDLEGTVLFLGFGLTFIFLYLQRNEENKLQWAIWPGGILSAIALFIYIQSTDWMDFDFILPAILILVGAYLIISASRKK